ncbi:hypothetical protein DL767_001286 [Monosporascus sp. MG133]|nr:hypothetical protein DL767_001286 [Monosporascus sp. MG133]
MSSNHAGTEATSTEQQAAADSHATPGSQPLQQLDVQDAAPDDGINYPSGVKLLMAVVSLCAVSFLFGLDLTIVAAAVPSLTDYFKTVEDIGWYSPAYSVMTASFTFLFGKLYTLAPAKRLYMVSICIFELGSVLCTVATTSQLFILGRAVAGVGAAGIISGTIVILTQCFPKQRRPFWTTVTGSLQMAGIVAAPSVGGGLIDWVGWRGCFGINLPLGAAALTMLACGLQNMSPPRPEGGQLSWKAKLKQFDWFGTIFMVPAVTCLLLGLQWGGTKFGWDDARIIVLLVLFIALLAAFGWRQHRLQENATLPPRILRMKTVLAAAWFGSCVNAALAVTEYYMSIYFQGVKGYTAGQAGLMLTPMLVGITIGNLCGGAGISWLGYYNPSGLLTTVSLNEGLVKVLCLLGFLGFATGVGLWSPIISLQTMMTQNDLPIGLAISGFGQTMGSAIWIVVSATLFQNRLTAELTAIGPPVNSTALQNAGLSDIRALVGIRIQVTHLTGSTSSPVLRSEPMDFNHRLANRHLHKSNGTMNGINGSHTSQTSLHRADEVEELHEYHVSPSPTLTEKTTARTLASILGVSGPNAGGVTCPGGSASNMTSLVIARNALYPSTRSGGNGGHRFVLFTSTNAHYSIEKAAITMGLGATAVVLVPVNAATGCMIPSALRALIVQSLGEGKTPFFVNATAGTTVLGAYDPFREIVAICKEFGLWFHVDGSWGGVVAFSAGQKHKLDAVELAHSITANPHKMLNVPITCSFLLTNDLTVFHRDAFKMALSWVYYGAAGFERQIEHGFEVARHLATLIEVHPDFVLVSTNPPPCLQVCFYYVPGGTVAKTSAENTRRTKDMMARLVDRGFMVDYAPGDQGCFFRDVVNCQTLEATADGLVRALEEVGGEVV